MAGDFTPYSTGKALFKQKPAYVSDELDQQRLQSYDLYERIYWNVPDVFKVATRGTNNEPLYVPSARTIIDTSNRYTATNFALNFTPKAGGQDTTDVIAARMAISDFMKREMFKTKFLGAKRFCQIQGDWVWHITADETKEVGTRLSIHALDPAVYFPQYDPENSERKIAVFLAEVVAKGDDQFVRRLCYRKEDNGSITSEEGLYKIDEWESLDAQPEEVLKPLTALPPEITSIPVYHIKNFEEPNNQWGSSEIRGFETLLVGLHQTLSDEDITLALQGIGQYVTDAPEPIDPRTRTTVPWRLGPGMVVKVPNGSMFNRIDGVGSVTPYGDHYDRIWETLKWASASPDIAIGTVDVKVAESGIALALQLSPILAKAHEKDELILGVHDQMFFDLVNMWYPAYEQTVFNEVSVEALVGDKVPLDRAARFLELNDMLDRNVIDTEYYRQEAKKLGYVFPDDIGTRADAERSKKDAFASSVAGELGGNGGATQQ